MHKGIRTPSAVLTENPDLVDFQEPPPELLEPCEPGDPGPPGLGAALADIPSTTAPSKNTRKEALKATILEMYWRFYDLWWVRQKQ